MQQRSTSERGKDEKNTCEAFEIDSKSSFLMRQVSFMSSG